MPGRKIRILYCPGLGADRAVFDPIRKLIPRGDLILVEEFLINLDPLSIHESMTDYSLRVIREAEAHGHYDVVIGCSLGGIIAQEGLENRLFTADNLVLLSTAFRGGDISSLFLPLIPILHLLPKGLYEITRNGIAVLYPLIRYRFSEAKNFASMLRRTSASLFFIAPIMVRGWRLDQVRPITLPRKTVHLHGMSDPLFSFAKISRFRIPDYPIAGGNHLVFVTEAHLIANIIMMKLGK